MTAQVQPPVSPLSRFCERASTALAVGLGVYRSLVAVETRGGDDDKLMLTHAPRVEIPARAVLG